MSTPPDLLLGPLTTTFTLPPECTSITVAGGPTPLPYVYPRLFSSIANSCFPSGYPLGNAAFTSTYGIYGYHDEHVYYSPGICPSGWSENIVSTSGPEKTAFCCQPGFNPQRSPAVIGGYDYLSTLCTSSISSTVIDTVAYTSDGEADGSSSIFTFVGANIPAPAIWIRYQDGDFTTTRTSDSSSSSSVPSSSTSVLSTSIPTTESTTLFTTSSPNGVVSQSTTLHTSSSNEALSQSGTSILSSSESPSSTTNRSATSTPKSEGLSVGAKIGLGLGIPLGVILFGLLAAFLFIRRRKQSPERQISELPAGEVEKNASAAERFELKGTPPGHPIPEFEDRSGRQVNGSQRYELQGYWTPAESASRRM